MEPPIPARAMLAIGTGVLLAVGGASAPLAGSATAARPGSDARVHASPAATHALVLARSAGARRSAGAPTARWSGSIRASRRTAVESAYTKSFASGLTRETGYTGSDSQCRPGTTSAASRAATLRALNFVRSMSGLAPVRFSSTLNARSQRTALMMSANRALNHAPPRGWRCWSGTGAANAGRSNLALSFPSMSSAGAIDLYMREPGAGNAAVGHRRWLLNPFATTMGSGATDTANAMTVIGPTAARRPNPAWVSWPTAGYFPRPLEPNGLWSLSAGNKRMNFSHATVRVLRNGHAVRTTKLRVQNGYAQPTLAWRVPAKSAKSGTFKVVVRGAHLGGSRKPVGRTYVVRMFTPSS
jgi:uncharacterized protein YkwD